MLSPREQLAALGITLAQAEADSFQEDTSGRPKFTDVEAGPEYHRIRCLPRRPHPDQESPEAVELAEYLTEGLSYGKAWPGPCRPIQALALREAWENNGAFMMLRVGAGKTLVAALLPVLMCQMPGMRPIYVCPSKMEAPVHLEFYRFANGHIHPVTKEHFDGKWAVRDAFSYPIVSYEKLSSKKSGEVLNEEGEVVKASYLERLRPTHIFLDESHCCASSGSAVTKRIDAYLEKYPDTVVVAMTGTPFKTSIKDAQHIMRWCLRDKAPLPDEFWEREMWASYLDARAGMGPRCGVGALEEFLTDNERRAYLASEFVEDQRSIVRRAIARWMLETPGVIGTQDPPLDTLLTVEEYGPQHICPDLCDVLEDLRGTWCLPDGTEFADGLEFARHMNTLAMGFWQQWDPAPREEYRAARNAWAKWCRKMIRYNKKGVETEGRMKEYVKKGVFDDEGLLEAWEAEVALYRKEHPGLNEPPSKSVWVSDECIEACKAWAAEHPKGLIWVNYIGLGERLAAQLGIPYYGAEGIDQRTGVYIERHQGGAAVASLAANGTGKNLQFLWCDNLWLCPPNEQALGRTHRAGQVSPVVRNWIYLGCAEHLKSYYAAKSTKAKFAEEITLSPQKLRYAQTSMPRMSELEGREGGARWAEKEKEDD